MAPRRLPTVVIHPQRELRERRLGHAVIVTRRLVFGVASARGDCY